MVVAFCLLVLGPVTFSGVTMGILFALGLLRGSKWWCVVRTMPVILGALGMLGALGEGIFHGDSVHMFWSVQVPLVGLFLCSGPFLATTWREPGEPDVADPCRRWLPRGAWSYLAITSALALVPLFHGVFFPSPMLHDFPGHGPVRDLREIALWGFGAAVPEALTPVHEGQIARGVGHLQRWNTVPMGTTLIAAWLWLGFCIVAFCGRLIPSFQVRRRLYLLAPLALAAVVAASPTMLWGAFDPRFFSVNGSRSTGIWKSGPEVMRSYGPVLAAALVATIGLAWARRRDGGTSSR